jgi:hypothetical protein
MSANVRHSAASVEHYTPAPIVEAARRVMGGIIHLDPFSCALANETVKAGCYFSGPSSTEEGHALCGFDSVWHPGSINPWCVFVNPPGGKSDGQSNQKRAWQKLATEHEAGRVTSAFFVCFSLELLQTTQVKASGKIPLDFPICYPSRRIAYMREPTEKEKEEYMFDHASDWPHTYTGPALVKGASPPHSSCFIFLPPPSAEPMWNREGMQRFVREFSVFGRVVIPSMVGA